MKKIIPGIEYTYDEVGMFAKEEVTLTGEDKEVFDKLYNLLDAIDDVSAIYTNVKLD
ncbi:MAG: YebC/PmpR family DNA-binding transcriptional regulator [Clostridium sp.]|nr:MAG: YebC/PmpR family DNA-binding transcriptional regulator [Clostridium sp.]